MPVSRMKSAERPGESRQRNTAIHHWVLLDIRKVIQSDGVMPYQLRINPKRHHRQTEQDKEVGSLERRNLAELERSLLAKTFGVRGSPGGCGKADCFSLLRRPFSHPVYESI